MNPYNLYYLKIEARDEAYIYFDKKVRPLKRKANGQIDETADGLDDNDVDAFRHAYVSGRYTQKYSTLTAIVVGFIQEVQGNGYGSTGTAPSASKNMDFWNNAVGRKYGKKSKSNEELLKMIHQAMDDGELILNPNDPRIYKGQTEFKIDADKPVVVLNEQKTGRNEEFSDLFSGDIMSREQHLLMGL